MRQPVKGGAKPAAGKAQRHLQAKQGRCVPAAPVLCSCVCLCGADRAAGWAQGPAAGGAAGAAPRRGAAARGCTAAALCCESHLSVAMHSEHAVQQQRRGYSAQLCPACALPVSSVFPVLRALPGLVHI